MSKHTISCSTGLVLHFQEDETYTRFLEEEKQLYMKYYSEIKAKYGIWASSQNRFVSSVEELDYWDSKFMEELQ